MYVKASSLLLLCGLMLVGVCPGQEIHCREVTGGIEIRAGEKLVLRYNTAIVEPPAGIDPVFRRSGHIHPLNTPSGKTVTAEFPPDHAHQHGVFFAWVQTEFEGRKVDFWNQAGKTGRVSHVRVERVLNGPDAAGFTAVLHHEDLTAPHGPVVVLEEEWTLTAYPPTEHGYLFDLVSRQTCVASSPLTLLEYHYGGLAFRGNSEWLNQPQSDFLTSEGLTREKGNHSRPDWVNLHGLLEGEPCGITIFNHPGNLRSPQPVRLHPSKPYFVFSPEVLGPHKIFPGESLVSRYRFLIHDGNVVPAAHGQFSRAFGQNR